MIGPCGQKIEDNTSMPLWHPQIIVLAKMQRASIGSDYSPILTLVKLSLVYLAQFPSSLIEQILANWCKSNKGLGG